MARKTIVSLEAEIAELKREYQAIIDDNKQEIYELRGKVHELHRTVDMLRELGATAANRELLNAISKTAEMLGVASESVTRLNKQQMTVNRIR